MKISADTFSEINPSAELAVLETLREWLVQSQQLQPQQWCIYVGRDLNTHILTLDEWAFYPHLRALSHCPLAVADCIENCRDLRIPADVRFVSNADLPAQLAVLDEGMLVMSAGRNGKGPAVMASILENPAFRCVIYNSCNQKTMESDLSCLLRAPNGFEVRHATNRRS